MSMPGPATPWEAEEDATSERAAEFLAQRRCGTWSGADQAALDAWLKESVLNEVAWLRVSGIAARADRLAVLNAFEMKRSEGMPGLRRFVFPLLAAASLALFAALGFPFVSSLLQPPARTFSTDIGGRTMLSFADHTQIELNTDTIIRFRMSNTERTVWLDRGEAWFHVAHNAANPFNLIVGKDRVTDLGTEFLVRRDAGRLEVALIEGKAALAAQGTPSATLVAGEEAVATSLSLSVTRKTPLQLADELAWRRGTLVFRKTKLADVVAEFNRYNATKLVIADPAIADTRITAELGTNDYESFLQIAQATLNLHVAREGMVILISKKVRQSKK